MQQLVKSCCEDDMMVKIVACIITRYMKTKNQAWRNKYGVIRFLEEELFEECQKYSDECLYHH